MRRAAKDNDTCHLSWPPKGGSSNASDARKLTTKTAGVISNWPFFFFWFQRKPIIGLWTNSTDRVRPSDRKSQDNQFCTENKMNPFPSRSI